MKTMVVIPTYNERENIEKLIKEIFCFDRDIKVIVVDDNSPDKTFEVVEKIGKKDKRVKLILRKNKRGRGSAVVDGFKYGLKDKKTKYFFEMDADFSHDPKELGKFFEKIKKADVVIGSRYLKKSKIIGWPLKRHIFSRLANFYAWLILRVPITDYTNGFRCYKRRVLESIDLGKIKSSGYIVLSEMAYKIYRKEFKFAEVAVVFVNRQRGASNLRLEEIVEAFTSVWRIRFS